MASNATGTPQSALYNIRQGVSPDNRDRSAEQRNTNSGNPMAPLFNTSPSQYSTFYAGQDPNLGRYTPPTINNPSNVSGAPQWNNNPGGYAYNLPNAYGGYQGTANSWLTNYLGQGGPQLPNWMRDNRQDGPGGMQTPVPPQTDGGISVGMPAAQRPGDFAQRPGEIMQAPGQQPTVQPRFDNRNILPAYTGGFEPLRR